MTYRQIFNAAISLIAEDIGSGTITDYEDRAGYILAVFCNQTSSVDKKYRQANGLSTTSYSDLTCVSLDSTFPLQVVFESPAAYYLGSMLTVDENDTLSERLFAQYTDALASIIADLPCSTASVSDAYRLI